MTEPLDLARFEIVRDLGDLRVLEDPARGRVVVAELLPDTHPHWPGQWAAFASFAREMPTARALLRLCERW